MIETLIGVVMGMVALMIIQGVLERAFMINLFNPNKKKKGKKEE